MTWNYRIIKYKDWDNTWGIHEVYYNNKGDPCAMTENAVGFVSDVSVEDLIGGLEMALKDVRKHPVLDEPDTWGEFDDV